MQILIVFLHNFLPFTIQRIYHFQNLTWATKVLHSLQLHPSPFKGLCSYNGFYFILQCNTFSLYMLLQQALFVVVVASAVWIGQRMPAYPPKASGRCRYKMIILFKYLHVHMHIKCGIMCSWPFHATPL